MSFNPRTSVGIEFEELILIAKEYGVERFKVGTTEVHFAGPVGVSDFGKEEKMPTEDQLLFMSGVPMSDDELKAHAPHG